MPFYKEHVYPHLVSMLGNPKPIEEIRQRIVPLAQGNVLEIGVGPGVNFVHYDPLRVSKVILLSRIHGCFGTRRNKSIGRGWKSSFSICLENAFPWETQVSIQL